MENSNLNLAATIDPIGNVRWSIPRDKKLNTDWVKALVARGMPERYTGSDLRFIGMPVGGLFCGLLYLGGDGKLWLWDIFNNEQEGIVPKTITVYGCDVRSRDGSAYVEPPAQFSPVEQGFAVEINGRRHALDRHGFQQVTFTGQYPIGTITYADPTIPVTVTLEAYSPFIPLNADDSGLPATVMAFTVKNTGATPVEMTLVGSLENTVCINHRDQVGTRRNQSATENGFTFLNCTASGAAPSNLDALPDYGSMGLALLGQPAEHSTGNAVVPLGEKLVGELGCRLRLAPGESATATFVVTWFFPNYRKVGRYYAAKFDSALAVARYVAGNFARLSAQTRLWRDTWYDSTLPYWFLNRTFANTSTLATTTCYRHKSGRFWAWEGVGCCPGTCTHVWHYAQAMGRLFPEIERDQRRRVDFGLALDAAGAIAFRAEDGATYALDGQAGRILGAYREHQMSADDQFLRSVWPGVKQALQKLLATDAAGNGLVFGPLHNTLDADWHGLVPWLNGLYHAALRAGEELAKEIGDAEFARQCRTVFAAGVQNLDARCWRESFGYYVQEPDANAPQSIGVYDGCHIDQVLGQSWARQVGLGDVMKPEHVKRALQSLWDYNFTPDVGPFRAVNKAGRWYALAGDGGMIMASYPFTPAEQIIGRDHWTFGYLNECMSGFEHQVAAHMLWDGFVMEGLAVTRAVHDRYNTRQRNPYNEIECSDHYARAMASYGTFIAACGFEYHGPKGHIGFAPRLTPESFRAAFTTADGWGTYSQKDQTFQIHLKWGKLRLRTLAFTCAQKPAQIKVLVNDKPVDATHTFESGRLTVTLTADIQIVTGQRVVVAG